MTLDATSVTDDADTPLYAARKRIYPKAVSGRFRRIKWIALALTLGVYYFLPFLRWDRGPGAPDQAVLVDLPHRRFYFFFIEIWPQEVYYITGLLILASLALFLMNALAGRVWCGYLCPQTVWTDLFYAVERLVEGDPARSRHKPWIERFAQKLLKHWLWLMIAWWTGGAWVLYFADAPTLVYQLATFQAPALAYGWIAILTFTTYALAGFMREQVCIYMCPWPRIQAALTDEYALNVTYRYDRGEPRYSFKKGEARRAQALPAGDCVDCVQCIAVCPTGVDIREGLQLDCIQCGLCIDACDSVMSMVGRPTGLIAYDTDMNVKARLVGQPEVHRLIRPRTILYAVLIVLVGAVMVAQLATRETLSLSAIHDRNPVFVTLSDGSIRNAYTIRIANKELQAATYALSFDGPAGATLALADGEAGLTFTVEPDQTREVRALLTLAPPVPPAASLPITFILTRAGDGRQARGADHFRTP
jgi:cytochrome c oxidase accessory protein FixG